MRASNVEEVTSHGAGDPWEVFTQLVILIIEGRTPGGEKGFHAGPHCSLPHQTGINRHVCDPNSSMCARVESLLRQLRLMWGVGVGVTVEVLVAPECEHGVAFTTTLDTTTAPSPQLRLIEQWNFTIFDRNMPDGMLSGWSLVAAVRSFLHFSQLSAWLSVSGGARPPNVLYRLTVTSPVFCSKFEAESEEHIFPVANVGQETAIKVVVRSLPRSSQAPIVACHEAHQKMECLHSFLPIPSSSSSSHSTPLDSFSSSQYQQNISKTEGNSKAEEDLRRSMMRARLGDPSRVSRSESPDTQLGESLLDPPNSLSRIPRRFQSPSRSGSPSLETPEHIICRVRQPGPSHGRPPDITSFCQHLVIPARQPLNSFAWTQTRYPSVQQQQQQQQQQQPYNPPHPYHHQSVHSEIFHAPAVPSEPLPVNHQYNPSRVPFSSFPHNANPQCFYNSNSQLFWPHQENIPTRDKHPSSFPHQYQLLHHPHTPRSHFDEEQQQITQRQEPQSRLLEGIHNQQQQQQQQKKQQQQFFQRNYSNNNSSSSSSNSHINLSNSPFSNEKYLVEFAKPPSNLSTENNAPCPFVIVPASETAASTSSSSCNIDNIVKVVSCTEDVQGSTSISPSKSREAQGMKRKGAYNKESPRTKRESPPHVYYSKEGKGIEDLREEAKEEEEELRKRKNDEEGVVSSRRKSCSNKRGMVNDQLWPSCSQSGKHLCSSVEDLAEIIVKEEQSDFMPNAKSLRKAKRTCCKMDTSCNTKVSFDLTPKETQEVLRVLRQNTPVPPLRINQHKNPNQSSTMKISRMDGIDAGQGSNCFRLLGKSEKTSKLKCSEGKTLTVDALSSKSKGESLPIRDKGKTFRCHRHEASKTKKGPESKGDGNAYPTSSNKPCDTSFKKSLKCTCDTKLENVINVGRDDEEFNDSDEEVLDGLSLSEIENMKETERRTKSSCVEARTVTQKTSYFTANSQPASQAKDIHKQTSQALGKSPLTSLLSSIKSDSMQGAKECEEKSKQKAKRALIFDGITSASSREGNASEKGIVPRDTSSEHTEVTSSKKEAREDFVKSVSMLKHHLMKKPFLSEEKSFERVQARFQKKKEEDEDEEDSKGLHHNHSGEGCEKSTLNGHKRPLLNSEEESTCNEEDKEVEDLCRAKGVPIPSTSEKVKFRRSLDSAATLVFHNKTGLPLTSSPAPLRKGTSFDYDSTLNSIAAIRSAFRACDSVDEECDNLCKDDSFATCLVKSIVSASAPATVTCSNLLGSFEECVLNGRLEPVSTVHGFTAEIAASGVFCPKHTTKPVTVFFYTLCDNDQISSPYMGHINLGKKGYHIPSQGTVQVTLFNPHGTVVKMFVVVYDLSDMPPNSKTFLRQRTLNMPVGELDTHPDAHQWLRYLIHLRFASSKSGKIYLHTDIRMLILRKSDADAATLHKNSVPYELRSFTHGPTNPKFSPRK